MGNYQVYEKYKDSGVEWLGDIPEHWETKKLKYVGIFINGFSFDSKDFQSSGLKVLKITNIQNMTIDWNDSSYLDEASYEKYSKFQVYKNDLVFALTRPIISTGIKVAFIDTDEKILLNQRNSIFRTNVIPIKWIYFILLSQSFIVEFDKKIDKTGQQPNISSNDIGNIVVPIPPIKEQKAIANFLDRKTKQIDDLIAKKEALLAKLDEKRSAIISHAVTKGLDPTVPMKDSGVEWLGDIPEHWEFLKIKFLCKEIISGPFGSSLTKDMYVKSGYKIYGQEQVIANNFSIGDYCISEEKYKEMSRYSVNTGDILISCVGTFGKISVVPKEAEAGIINPRLIKLNLNNEKIEPDYFGTLLSSNISFCQFDKLSRGGTMGVVNIGVLSMIELPIPPLNEQYLINKYLVKKTAEINLQKAKVQEAIERLKEYRTALITNAVTGKIDVRQVSLN